jgi:hypothetical protein
MLPEGAHNRSEDWTYMVLNRDGPQIDEVGAMLRMYIYIIAIVIVVIVVMCEHGCVSSYCILIRLTVDALTYV